VLHVRIVTPSSRTETVLVALGAVPHCVNLIVLPGAARNPAGDVVMVDVPPELANDVLSVLRARGVDRYGSITIDRHGTVLSNAALAAAAAAPGSSTEAVIWAEVEARSRDDIELTVSFVAMLVLAMLIAAVGIFTDSPILVIGAMVIGPEYGPVIGVALGLFRRRRAHTSIAARTLAVGFAVGIAVVTAFSVVVRLIGAEPDAYASGARPLTQFISRPDGWSVVVAVLAGVAGTLALTQSRPSALVGVFISVTTIPAAANVGVAAAFGRGDEAVGALAQLAVNLVVIVAAGALTFAIEQWAGRRFWRRRRALP
jgi:uncharacterized hydrophobic protein (TIGR00271 family)